jgi:biopolymer transport protein ExbB/TolQ
MVIALWVLVIHLIELTIVGVFLLIRRNSALEKAFIEQQEYIDAIGIIAADSEARLKELDLQGAFQADDEVGTFFTNLKEIQTLVSQFNIRKN